MHLFDQWQLNRRTFLGRSTTGIGSVVLASLLRGECSYSAGGLAGADQEPASASRLGIVRGRHFAPRANRVIFLCMAGGPSQLESFSYKPKLAAMDGKPMPESFTKGQPIAQLQGAKQLTCLGSQCSFLK